MSITATKSFCRSPNWDKSRWRFWCCRNRSFRSKSKNLNPSLSQKLKSFVRRFNICRKIGLFSTMWVYFRVYFTIQYSVVCDLCLLFIAYFLHCERYRPELNGRKTPPSSEIILRRIFTELTIKKLKSSIISFQASLIFHTKSSYTFSFYFFLCFFPSEFWNSSIVCRSQRRLHQRVRSSLKLETKLNQLKSFCNQK